MTCGSDLKRFDKSEAVKITTPLPFSLFLLVLFKDTFFNSYEYISKIKFDVTCFDLFKHNYGYKYQLVSLGSSGLLHSNSNAWYVHSRVTFLALLNVVDYHSVLWINVMHSIKV